MSRAPQGRSRSGRPRPPPVAAAVPSRALARRSAVADAQGAISWPLLILSGSVVQVSSHSLPPCSRRRRSCLTPLFCLCLPRRDCLCRTGPPAPLSPPEPPTCATPSACIAAPSIRTRARAAPPLTAAASGPRSSRRAPRRRRPCPHTSRSRRRHCRARCRAAAPPARRRWLWPRATNGRARPSSFLAIGADPENCEAITAKLAITMAATCPTEPGRMRGKKVRSPAGSHATSAAGRVAPGESGESGDEPSLARQDPRHSIKRGRRPVRNFARPRGAKRLAGYMPPCAPSLLPYSSKNRTATSI